MGRKNGLFLPDERCVGGAMELNAIYNHMQQSTAIKGVTAAEGTAQAPTAQQLSLHRARKLAQSDSTAYNHMLNLHHMGRRIRTIQQTGSLSPGAQIQLQYSSAATATAAPAGGQRSRKAGAVLDMCPWLPRSQQPENRRPSSAPGALVAGGSRKGQQQARQLTDWQQFKQRWSPVPQPPVLPVQLPRSRYYFSGPSLLPSVQYKLYKASIMQDIVERQLYRAADIRALCQHYIAVNPLEHRELLRAVAADVLQDLNVQY